jgi:hypothetical protein
MPDRQFFIRYFLTYFDIPSLLFNGRIYENLSWQTCNKTYPYILTIAIFVLLIDLSNVKRQLRDSDHCNAHMALKAYLDQSLVLGIPSS